jgi:RNA-binding protein YlmH
MGRQILGDILIKADRVKIVFVCSILEYYLKNMKNLFKMNTTRYMFVI